MGLVGLVGLVTGGWTFRANDEGTGMTGDVRDHRRVRAVSPRSSVINVFGGTAGEIGFKIGGERDGGWCLLVISAQS